ncbi:MAG: hypothetical protein KC466_01230, partial [Myxococcales bacterium]|nr:hypothetical protein [Myxococcales bacterium]
VANLQDFTFKAFTGAWKLAGDVNLADKARPRWNVTQSVADVDTNALLTMFASVSDVLFGAGNQSLQLGGVGFKTDDILASVKGSGKIDVSGGRLEGVNLLSAVIEQVEKRLGGIPALAAQAGLGSIKDYIPADELNVRTTSFERFAGDYTIGGRKVNFQNLGLVTKQWDAGLRGTVGFDKKLDMDGEMIFSQKRSASLVEKNKYLRYLVDADGRMHFPMALTGSVTKPIPTVKLTQEFYDNVARRALETVAQEQLDKLLNKKKKGDGDAPAKEPKPGQKELENLGRDVLDQLLRGGK